MEQVKIIPLKKELVLSYADEDIDLSPETKKQIEAYWAQLAAEGKKFTRGDVFHITKITEDEKRMEINFCLTDYAHYMATIGRKISSKKERCQVVYSCVLIKTKDDFWVVGEMADNTSTPGRLQCPGGGITKDDLVDKKIIDIKKNAALELFEEVGLKENEAQYNCTLGAKYIKSGGDYDFIGVVFLAEVALTCDEVRKVFLNHNQELEKKGEQAELSDLVFIKNNKEKIENFFRKNTKPYVDYLPQLLVIEA